MQNYKSDPSTYPVCKTCSNIACQDLYRHNIVVKPELFDIHLFCPLRIKDEWLLRRELYSIDSYHISRIANDVWCKHNFTTRSSNLGDVELIINFWHRHECAAISRSVNPFYKPWKHYGFWANTADAASIGEIFNFGKEKEEINDIPVDYIQEEKKVVTTPVKLAIKEIGGPAQLAVNEKGIYSVKTFNRAPSDNEKKSVGWIVKHKGKEVERHESNGVKFEFTAIGKYAGNTVTVHPFLNSPSDKLCIKTTISGKTKFTYSI